MGWGTVGMGIPILLVWVYKSDRAQIQKIVDLNLLLAGDRNLNGDWDRDRIPITTEMGMVTGIWSPFQI
jgi:hypothetical protein